MTYQEVYRLAVEAEFLELHQITLEQYLTSIVHRFGLAGYSARDCAASIHYALEHETTKAERQAE